MTPVEQLLRREAASLVSRLRAWPPARWTAAASPFGSRADVAHHLAQALADAAADAEGCVRRRLPRLPNDLVLPDQIAVTADDLVRAQPPPDVAVAAVAHLLVHRQDLLGDEIPASLAPALGLADVAAAGRAACAGSP